MGESEAVGKRVKVFCAVEREDLWPTLRPTQSSPEILLPGPVSPISLLDLSLLLLHETVPLGPVKQGRWAGEIAHLVNACCASLGT